MLGMLGTFLDGYDLVIGTTAATLVFSKVLFPPVADQTLTTVYSLIITTLVTFLFRPVGAFIFGHVGDRLGRKVGLLWDLVLTGLGSLIIGLAPDYGTAGYLGLAMVLIGRILVGIGLGGEQGGAVALALEQAHAAGSRRRAFWAAVPYMAWALVATAATGVFAVLSAAYPGDAFLSFGWRIAFYIGAAAALVGIVLRWILLESIPFEEARRSLGVARMPAVEVFRFWRPILATAFIYGLGNVAYYIWTSYSITYATGVGFTRDAVLQATAVTGILALVFAVAFTVLADVVGRRPIILAFSALSIPVAVAWPLLLVTQQVPLLLLAQTLLAIVIVGVQAPVQALSAEHFPTRYRYSGTGLGIQIGAAIGAGIATSVIAGLVGKAYAQMWWVIPAVLSTYATLSIASTVLLTRETIREEIVH